MIQYHFEIKTKDKLPTRTTTQAKESITSNNTLQKSTNRLEINSTTTLAPIFTEKKSSNKLTKDDVCVTKNEFKVQK